MSANRRCLAEELAARTGIPVTPVPTPYGYRSVPGWVLAAEGGGVGVPAWRRWTCRICAFAVERHPNMGPPVEACSHVADRGDETCATADHTPEAAAGFLMNAVQGAQTNARDRMLAAVLTWLRQTEQDWERLGDRRGDQMGGAVWAEAIREAKGQRDSELVALFQAIGVAL